MSIGCVLIASIMLNVCNMKHKSYVGYKIKQVNQLLQSVLLSHIKLQVNAFLIEKQNKINKWWTAVWQSKKNILERKVKVFCYTDKIKRPRTEQIKHFILSHYWSTLALAQNDHYFIIACLIFKMLDLVLSSMFVILTIEKVT